MDWLIICSNRDLFIRGQERETQSCLCVFYCVRHLSFICLCQASEFHLCVCVRHLSFICVPVCSRPQMSSQVKSAIVQSKLLSLFQFKCAFAQFTVIGWFTEVPCHFVFPSCLLLALPPSVDSTGWHGIPRMGTACALEWVYWQEFVKGQVLPL